MPSSPRGWFCRSAYILDAQARPFSVPWEYRGRTDPRMRDSRETALSIKIMLERASTACTKNGVGVELLTDYYVREASWWRFTEREQAIIKKTARTFAKALREAGFLPGKG